MFGFTGVPFPGRAVLEGIGAGLDLPAGVAATFAALRTSKVVDGRLWITGRTARDDEPDATALFASLAPALEKHSVQSHLLGRGEALLLFTRFGRGGVTDSDPFFEDVHPWLRVRATDAGTSGLADSMNAFLRDVRALLLESPVNRARRATGKPAFDVLTTKWSGAREAIPGFIEQCGVAGAAVTSTRMYRGLAGLLGMAQRHLKPQADLGKDIAGRIEAANQLIAAGARFVHVHTKATDEAGHTKDPFAKLKVLEALDAGLGGLEDLAGGAIVAITGDHATPSVDGVLHTSDPTPLLLVGPTVRPDGVARFGEQYARAGWYGVVHAKELLPLLFGHANRPMFLGHRATPLQPLALPDDPEPMPLL